MQSSCGLSWVKDALRGILWNWNRRRVMKKLGKKNNWAAYLYILPLMLLSFAVVYYCIIRTFMTSFTDWNGMSPEMNFVGMKNYIKLFKDATFWKSVTNNVIF